MKNKIILSIALFMFCVSWHPLIFSQSITLSPSKDAYLLLSLRPGSEYMANSNYGSYTLFSADEWTAGGYRTNVRSIIDFDLTGIPSGAHIAEARLSFYAMQPQPNDNYRHMNYITMQNTGYKSNACYLERITENWDEKTVTYNTQPASITTNRVILPISQTFTEDYLNVDVTSLVRDMLANPASSFGFMLRLVSESRYTRMALCSGDHLDSTRHPRLTLRYLDRLSTSNDYNLLLKGDGTLWAWGDNSYGQLGDGTIIGKNLPVQVGDQSDWKQVSAGYTHAAGIKNDGTLWVWGTQGMGELGDPTQRIVPELVDSSTNWAKVSAGFAHNLAIKTDGSLWAWGNNKYGELGDGTMFNKLQPVKIGYAKDWKEIEAGFLYSLAIKTDGTLWTWGDNRYGQLGDGTTSRRVAPVKITGDNNWKQTSSGGYHTMALKTDGTLWVWGNNTYGQLGDGTTTPSYVPVEVGSDNSWQSIDAGYEFSMATAVDNTLWGWGSNTYGQLGDGTNSDQYSPVKISNIPECAMAAAGWSHTIILDYNNKYCGSGLNIYGQLGDGTYNIKNTFDCFPADPVLKSSNAANSSNTFGEGLQTDDQESSYLLYNSPNPSDGITTVFYHLAEEPENASIAVYNMFDGQTREFRIVGSGSSSIQLYLQDMPAGIYSYFLIVNDKKVDEKKMVIVR
ncbi:MAG: DNRLRE domain-containing protein [Bacteroidales bacterium]|nr:DNRLRE domain-containing protein [Bacteroidales bacterium]